MNQLVSPRQEKKDIFSLLDNPKVQSGLKAVAGKYITADRLTRLVTFAIKKTPKLLECDQASLLGAVMTTAALELEPNTPRQLAWLIPYKGRRKVNGQWIDVYECQFQIGYRGWIELANRNPDLLKLTAGAIHENDLFEHMEGSESFLRYRKELFKERGGLVAAFCYTKYVKAHGEADMAYSMPLDEIHKVRAKSETYKALVMQVENAQNEAERRKAEQKLAETPWVMWEDDMAAKSAIKKLCKQLPIGGGLTTAAMVDDAADMGTLDLKAMSDPNLARAIASGEEDPPMIEHHPEETITEPTQTREKEPAAQQRQARGNGKAKAAAEPPEAARQDPRHDPETGEIHEDGDGRDQGGLDFSD